MDIRSEFKSLLKRDAEWSDIVRIENIPKPLRKTSEVFAHSGDTKLWLAILAVVLIFGNSFWRPWAVTLIIGIGLMGLAMWPFKHLLRRKRPIGLWGMKTRKKDPESFPSGHAARSFLLAVLVTGLGPAWLAVLFWIWAPLSALARVAVGVHYILDTVGGLVLAIIVGVLWLHFHEGALQLIQSFFIGTLHVVAW